MDIRIGVGITGGMVFLITANKLAGRGDYVSFFRYFCISLPISANNLYETNWSSDSFSALVTKGFLNTSAKLFGTSRHTDKSI